MEIKYKIGKIYCIYYNEIKYIGSTFQKIHHRFNTHKAKYNFNKKNNILNCKCMIYNYFDKFGIENFNIKLIKEYLVQDKKQLLAYETLWMNKVKTINKYNAIPFLLKKHYDSIKQKKWRKNNRDKCSAKTKRYASKPENKEKIKIRQKKWRDNNKEKMKIGQKKYVSKPEIKEKRKIKQKEWRDNNKEKIKIGQKKWRDNNKEKIKIKQKEWRDKNKLLKEK